MRHAEEFLLLPQSSLVLPLALRFQQRGIFAHSPKLRVGCAPNFAARMASRRFILPIDKRFSQPKQRRACLGRRRPPVRIRTPRPKHLACFLWVTEGFCYLKRICGILADRRSSCASRLVSENAPHQEYAKTRRGRSAIQK